MKKNRNKITCTKFQTYIDIGSIYKKIGKFIICSISLRTLLINRESTVQFLAQINSI